ncbi:Ankyrin repeat family protein [Abeliophyllum distichum]|uniref:Ankyrin repeat family protein n=1 Tax=Abeliophyllum distichum TaxID=126358 RepID=A0ABD1NP06_9LAMI
MVCIALHAARVEDHQRLNLRATAPGAALQMQRELQWFKEVEKFMLPRDKQQKNTEGRTPGMVFTENHAELIKEGEQWMKDKANSCMFVAALIAAVVFAAAITVPGGNNQDNGLPIFSIQNAFGIFAISDALCLFCSVSSIIMFLSILTSRYAADFSLRTTQ